LRDHLDDYRRLAELHAILREAYGGRPTSFIGELCHKTEMLVRTTSDVAALDRLTKVVEFDEAALDAPKKQPGSDEGKVINLARSLQQSAQQQGDQEPHLIPIGERTDAIREQFEERLISTEQAGERLEALAYEKLEAVQPRSIRVQRMTRKWGSCSYKGILSFSADVLCMDCNFQDYVIVHELPHLRLPNHGKLFRSLLTVYVPQWQLYTS
jgi:predicted metal-dependent hydrolase